jgi:hypothetical protein
MLESQTQGFYDIQRSRKGGPTVTYRWSGRGYVMDGTDRADRRAREEWDWCGGRRYLADHGFPPRPSTTDDGGKLAATATAPVRLPCARAAFRCSGCAEAGNSPFKVGESFVDMKRVVAAANERLQAEDAAGKPRVLGIGPVNVSLLEVSTPTMAGMAFIRQDPGGACVIGEWAWDWGGNGVRLDVASVAPVPSRNAVLVVLKASGESPHGTEPSSYYPDQRQLRAFLITATRVDDVLSEPVDQNGGQNDGSQYGEWPEPVRVEVSAPSLRIVYRDKVWLMGPGAESFAPARKRSRR